MLTGENDTKTLLFRNFENSEFFNAYFHYFVLFRLKEFAMVDVKTEGKDRESEDLKAKLEEEGELC